MAKHLFKPGESGNPGGRPKVDPELKAIRELERTEMTKEFSKMLRMTKNELITITGRPDATVKELGIAKGIVKWVNSGDFKFVQPYIEYIFGKPKETHEIPDDTVNLIFSKLAEIIK